MNLRLFVVEPESIRRRLICDSASQAAGLSVVGSCCSLLDTDPETAPDIFLVNASLLGSEHSALLASARRQPDAFFVLYGAYPDVKALLCSSELPLRGFLSFNHLAADEFAQALRVIAYGGAVIEPLSAQLLLDYLRAQAPARIEAEREQDGSRLTEREREVLSQVQRGLSNKEIAMRMGISLGTVRAHLRNIFRKLDVTSRAGAAVSSLSLPALRRRLAG